MWRRRFGADRNVLGRTVQLSGNPYTIIGVMPRHFIYPIIQNAELWTPAQLEPVNSRGNAFLRVIARLKPGVSLQQAQAEMSTIAARLEQQYPETNKGGGIYLANLQADMAGGARPALLVLLGAVGFVLLIACANVANLLLARASVRQKEIAVRTALGASRGRLIAQLLTESVLLSAAGGVLGLAIAYWTSSALGAYAANSIGQSYDFSLDGAVLAFTAVVSLATGMIFGLAPALEATRTGLQDSLKEGARGSSGARQNLRRVLVVSEVALSLVLLVGAGLLMKSFYLLLKQNPGFNPKNVVAMSITLPQTKYPEAAQSTATFAQILETIRALPGVKSAGAVNNLPLGPNNSDATFFVQGQPDPPAERQQRAWYTPITSGYLETMQIPLLRGS